MRLTILGSSGTHPSPFRACASYLLEHDGYRLLLDCGNGSLSNLLKVADVAAVDQVMLSHLHPDHFVDIYGLYYALRFHRDGPQRLPVLAPEGAEAFIAQLLYSDATFADLLPMTTAAAGQRLALGPFTVELFAAAHPVETLAPRISAAGRVVAYSGDSGPTKALVDCARDADVFLCDSTWLERDRPHPEGLHMTGAEAGQLAEAAGVARLICTHVQPPNDPETVAGEAREWFAGEVLVAHDLDGIEV
jgi:ribonuclease BN (tRNA processing enzyme)